MIWLVLLLMSGCGVGIPFASAQTKHAKKAAPKATRWPIQSLTVEGNHNYTQDQVLAVTGLKLGQLAGKDEFEAARDRLTASGVFETVGYKFAPGADGKGYSASFQVVEVDPAYPIRFEDLGVPEKDLTAYLRGKDPLFAPKLAATKPILERYTKWIQEYVTAHDSKDKVIVKVMPITGQQFAIVFRPARAEPAVAQVSFEGNQVIPSTMLQNKIAEAAVGAPYHEDRFRLLLDAAIRPLYDARGRVRVSFPKIAVQNAPDVEGLSVKVTVDEGVTYDLGHVQIEGADGFKNEDLFKAAKFQTGELANFDEVGKGVDRIKKILKHQGYLRNDIEIVRKIDDTKKTVELMLRVSEGPQFSFGTLRIDGLDLNGEAAIKKMWTLKEGKPYNPDYPDYFLSRVHEEGIFDNLGDTHSEAKVNEQARTVDVTVYFKGGAPANNPRKRREF